MRKGVLCSNVERIKFFFIALLCLGLNKKAAAQVINYDSLRQVVATTKDEKVKIKTLLFLADWYSAIPDSEYHYAVLAKDAAAKIYDKSSQAYAMGCIGETYMKRGNFVKAFSLYSQALKTFEELKDSARLANTYMGISFIYQSQRNYTTAKYYNLKCYNLARQINDYQDQFYGARSVARIYRDMNQLDSSLYFTQIALGILKQGMALGSIPGLLQDLSLTYNKLNQKARSEQYLHEALEIATKENDASLPNIQVTHAEMLLQENKTDSALFYANLAKGTLEKNASSLGSTYNVYSLLARLYEKKGDFEQAYSYQNKSNVIKDSLLSTNQMQQVANLAFNQQQNEIDLKNAEREYQNKLKLYAVLGGLALAIVVIFFLFSRSKKQQKANRLLQKQKERIQETLAELKATQAQLVQSEKMASLGELTAGIAHEIQNPLNFVNNFSDVSTELVREMEEALQHDDKEEAVAIASDIKDNLQKINHHGKRADVIVKGMLQHSRASTGKKEPTDINALADEYLRLAYHGLRAKDKDFNANFNTDFDTAIGQIDIVPEDIGRVLLNLFNNAFYSVNEKKKQLNGAFEPTVEVSTSKHDGKVEIHVKDNGTGIPQKVVDKIFQPFFTTKPTGQGTGLGLSLSYDIIKAHGGELKVETTEGEFAEFVLILRIA